MKLSLVILCLISFVFISCKSQQSIVGKWHYVQSYDPSSGKWGYVKEAGISSIEFKVGGKVTIITDQSQNNSEYTIDTNVIPNRIVLTGGDVINGVYKVENNKLLIKWNMSAEKSKFPSDIGIDASDNYVLIEFEREK